MKETIVREKGYLNLRLVKEEIAEFTHQPSKAKGVYRMVVLCKTILEERGQRSLGQRERYHFYVTNDFTMSAEDVVRELVRGYEYERDRYVVDYAIMTRVGEGPTEVHHDRHEEGLFPRATWERLLDAAGFTVERVGWRHSDVARELELFVARAR